MKKLIFKVSVIVVFALWGLPIFGESEQVRGVSLNRAWAISIDNDLFSPVSHSDADFTGGFAFTYSGSIAGQYHEVYDKGLSLLDTAVWGATLGERTDSIPGIELGLYGFTPSDVEQSDVKLGDRPYASLLYLLTSRSYFHPNQRLGVSTSLSIGVLGLDVFGAAQNVIHDVVGSDTAEGWHNQISDGGELTARYQIAVMDYWDRSQAGTLPRLKTTYFSSIGYITEAGVALSTASGLLASPSNRFYPELVSYGERVNDVAALNSSKRHFFWAGVSAKLRLYNVFLQGQFKSSAHTLASDEVKTLLFDAWIGFTHSMTDEYQLSYVLRWQSAEMHASLGGRDLIWGGIVLSRSL